MRISIIDDEAMLSRRIVKKLQANGYNASDFISYKDFFQNGNVLSDLYIIDIALGDGSGFDIIKYLRSRGCASPILILSGYGDTEKVIYGLNIGADDYLSKPFVPEVLIARVQALLRRPKTIEQSDILTYKGISLTPSTGIVEVNTIQIQLTRKEFFILEVLLRSQGKVVSKEDLIAKVWGLHSDEEISTNTVNVTLSKLRRKLGQGVHIETILNSGYKLF